MAVTGIKDSVLQIADIAHVYQADVDTKALDLSGYSFNNGKPQGDWHWIGDISAENVLEVSSDGGEATNLRSHDRYGVRTKHENETITLTINALNISEDTFNLGWTGVTTDASGMIKIGTNASAVPKALFVVIEDEEGTGGAYFPNTSIKGSFPVFDLENFTEIPLTCSVLGSRTQTTDAGPMAWAFIEPKRRSTSGSSSGSTGGNS